MIKLLRFLMYFISISVGWGASVYYTYCIGTDADRERKPMIKYLLVPLPVWFLLAFGLYSFVVVMYRTFTFNDCKEASESLAQEIVESKRELKKLGMKVF